MSKKLATQERAPHVDPDVKPPSHRKARPGQAKRSEKTFSSSRRGFLKDASTISLASLMGAAALLTNSDNAQAKTEWAEWFQGNYRLMTKEEKAKTKARLERRYSEEYGKSVTVDTTPAKEGVLFGYALNIQKCIGCRRCVKACVQENNQSRGGEQEVEWIRVIKMKKGAFTREKMNQGYPDSGGIQVGGQRIQPRRSHAGRRALLRARTGP